MWLWLWLWLCGSWLASSIAYATASITTVARTVTPLASTATSSTTATTTPAPTTTTTTTTTVRQSSSCGVWWGLYEFGRQAVQELSVEGRHECLQRRFMCGTSALGVGPKLLEVTPLVVVLPPRGSPSHLMGKRHAFLRIRERGLAGWI